MTSESPVDFSSGPVDIIEHDSVSCNGVNVSTVRPDRELFCPFRLCQTLSTLPLAVCQLIMPCTVANTWFCVLWGNGLQVSENERTLRSDSVFPSVSELLLWASFQVHIFGRRLFNWTVHKFRMFQRVPRFSSLGSIAADGQSVVQGAQI